MDTTANNATDINFGTKETTDIIDSNGSTKTLVKEYRNGEVKLPRRIRYEIRERVNNQDEEREIIKLFSDQYTQDRTMLDTGIKIERSIAGNKSGFYYVVKSYTRLEY